MLTNAQMLALRAAAMADGTAAGLIATADDQGLADWLNVGQSTFFVWRTSLTPDMSRSAIVQGATQLDSLTAGKRDSLFWLLSESVNPSDANVRAAIDDLCGTQAALKGALQSALKRTTTRAEKILASGTGTISVPATLAYEGYLSAAEASGGRVAQ